MSGEEEVESRRWRGGCGCAHPEIGFELGGGARLDVHRRVRGEGEEELFGHIDDEDQIDEAIDEEERLRCELGRWEEADLCGRAESEEVRRGGNRPMPSHRTRRGGVEAKEER